MQLLFGGCKFWEKSKPDRIQTILKPKNPSIGEVYGVPESGSAPFVDPVL